MALYSPEFFTTCRKKFRQAAVGPAGIHLAHESGFCGLSEVQTGPRNRNRAYWQAFIKKL
jgi:hypothetical protein